jgi:hypothetical protein
MQRLQFCQYQQTFTFKSCSLKPLGQLETNLAVMFIRWFFVEQNYTKEKKEAKMFKKGDVCSF